MSQTLRYRPDYKEFNPLRPFKRFYRVAKYFKRKDGQQWIPIDDTVGNTGHPLPVTGMQFTGAGWANQDRIGTINVTYYVKFRGLQQ